MGVAAGSVGVALAASVGGLIRRGTCRSSWVGISKARCVAGSDRTRQRRLGSAARLQLESSSAEIIPSTCSPHARQPRSPRIAPKGATREPPGPVPTLADLRRVTCWVWVHCEGCLHDAPLALAPWIIRWGPLASSNLIRRAGVCRRCGRRGAELQMPSWTGLQSGWAAFPVEQRS
jgi:hypothetical protein